MTANITPGDWFVRTRLGVDGKVVDCFVAAPPTNGLPYDAEILGDDEYREDDGIQRKLADAHLISAARDLLTALEHAHAGLLWYRDLYPEVVDGSDDEADEMIVAAIAKANGGAV